MNQSFTISTPTIEQIPTLSLFFSNTLIHSFPEFSPQARTTYETAFSVEALRDRINKRQGVLLTAWHEDTLCGIISGTEGEGGVATIIWLFVNPEHRQQGIGKSLFHEACTHYKNKHCHKIKLTAPTQRAKDYYLGLGMQEEGFHPKHWWGLNFWSLGLTL